MKTNKIPKQTLENKPMERGDLGRLKRRERSAAHRRIMRRHLGPSLCKYF
jgi:hypothetical protein